MNAILKNIFWIVVILLLLLVLPPIINVASSILTLLTSPLSGFLKLWGMIFKSDRINQVASNVKENLNITATLTGTILVLIAFISPISTLWRMVSGLIGLLLIRDGAANLASGSAVNLGVSQLLQSLTGNAPEIKAAEAKGSAIETTRTASTPLATYFN